MENITDIYPKKYPWLEKQKKKWMEKARQYFHQAGGKKYHKLWCKWVGVFQKFNVSFSEWMRTPPIVIVHDFTKEDETKFDHFEWRGIRKPPDFGIEELKPIIERYWEILKL